MKIPFAQMRSCNELKNYMVNKLGVIKVKKVLSLLYIASFVVMISACTTEKKITAQSLFDQYIVASYGDKGLESFNSMTMHGEMDIDNGNFVAPYVVKQMKPDHRQFETNMMGTIIGGGCSGENCWRRGPFSDLEMLKGEDLAFERNQADFYKLSHMDKYYRSLEIVKGLNDETSDTYQVDGIRKNGRHDIYIFSKKSKMLVTIIFNSKQDDQTKITVHHSDYKDFNGVMFPTKIENLAQGSTMTMKVDKLEFDKLNTDDFAIPE